jgi:prepilin-type N-terminal cleavage/methylation domain-containing protein
MKKRKKNKLAFSLIELSVVILIIGILVLGITKSSRIISESKLKSAQSLTQGSPVVSIPNLVLWIESTMKKSFDDNEKIDGGIGGNGTINKWYDINPNTTSPQILKQNSGFIVSAKPAYINNGINGLPVVRFLGNGAYLEYDASSLVSSNYTIFAVVQRRVGSSNNGFLGTFGGSVANTINFVYHNDLFWLQTGSDNGQASIPKYNSPVAAIFNASQSSTVGKIMFLNGAQILNSPSSTTLLTSISSAAIGRYSGSGYNGDIGEIIIFNRFLTNNERKSVESYLSQKWNIKVLS